MKYVRCKVAMWEPTYGILYGKVYKVVSEGRAREGKTFFIDTRVGAIQFYQYEFEVVGCPCGIARCIKHKIVKDS